MTIAITDYKKLPLTPKEKKQIEAVMFSWRGVYPTTQKMEDTPRNVEILSKMIAWEANNPAGPRAQILTRLHMRLNAMRNRLEFATLGQYATR